MHFTKKVSQTFIMAMQRDESSPDAHNTHDAHVRKEAQLAPRCTHSQKPQEFFALDMDVRKELIKKLKHNILCAASTLALDHESLLRESLQERHTHMAQSSSGIEDIHHCQHQQNV